jgi:hypothetical protein
MLEDSARAALGSLIGRELTDEEWTRAKARILEFARILRSWDRKAKSDQSKPDRN